MTPIKPWEKQLNSSCTETIATNINGPALPQTSSNILQQIRLSNNTLPPIPPRPNTTMTRPYSSFNHIPHFNYGTTYGNYGGYGGLNYGGYGMGGYGNMSGYGYGTYGINDPSNLESRFIQIAEDSSRPAFETIESVVRTFGSIAAMLDSTFFAMTSSFRAILGVADSFGRLRTLFQQMWASLAIFRALNWLLKKLLNLIGLKKLSVTNEAWKDAVSEVSMSSDGEIINSQRKHSWPVAVFLAVVVSAPYIISKLIGTIENSTHKDINVPTKQAIALYEFRASSKDELSLVRGQTVQVFPKEVQLKFNLLNSGWIIVKNQEGKIGRIPQNYIGYRATKPKSNQVIFNTKQEPLPSTSTENANINNNLNIEPTISSHNFSNPSNSSDSITSDVGNNIKNNIFEKQ